MDIMSTSVIEKPFKVTVPFLKVYRIFLSDPKQEHSGAEICRQTKLSAGTVYPMLIRLEESGWLNSKWENINPKKEKRPKRRLYKISAHGRRKGMEILAEHFPSTAGNNNDVSYA